MKDKVCLITGTASGMGQLTAHAAAEQGATVICVDFDIPNGKRVREDIVRDTGNENVDFIECDVTDFSQLRRLAETVDNNYQRLDVLVNNAGITESIRRESVHGHEMTMATNFLGPFLLTQLLLPKLKASTPSRIINICSDAHRMIKTLEWDDIDNRRKWDGVNHNCGFQAYARSKLCLAALSYYLAEQLEDTGVSVYTVSPGYFIRTNITRHMRGLWGLGVRIFAPFMQSPERGALTHIYLTTSPDVDGQTGKYWEHCELKESSAASHDRVLREKVWRYAEEQTGIRRAPAA